MGILQEILKTLSLPEFYFAMFRSATPVLLTTLGAMISSRSGTSNIALEGTMLISARIICRPRFMSSITTTTMTILPIRKIIL